MTQEQNSVPSEQTEAPLEDAKSDKPPLIMRQMGKIKDMNREFGIAFWQAQDTTARLNAGWELVAYYLKRKGRANELRLQRSVESLQRKSG
ncbi:MAG: hypothetical protein NT023_20385 [Armatimonadetes bacterium]|nr:hypothetical protein [Armatimonadota bacterium]